MCLYHFDGIFVIRVVFVKCYFNVPSPYCLQCYTGELGYDGPLYDGFLHLMDDMPGPNPMHIKY